MVASAVAEALAIEVVDSTDIRRSDADEIVHFESQVWVREGTDENSIWEQVHAKLFSFGIRLEGSKALSVVPLSGEHYVGDSLQRDHAFLVSDFVTTVYFSAQTGKTKQQWMQSIAKVLRIIGTREREDGTRGNSQMKPHPSPATSKREQAPSENLLKLRRIEKEYASALERLSLSATLRENAEKLVRGKELEENKKAEAEAEAARKKKEAEELKRKLEEEEKYRKQQEKLQKIKEERDRKQKAEADELIKQKQDQQERRKSLALLKKGGGILSRVQEWNSKVDDILDSNKENPFSKDFLQSRTPQVGDAEYGRAKAGSKTEERAVNAQAWVEKEVDKLCSVILDIGDEQPDGTVTVTFGKLFITYQDISDTLVGILMRARRKKKISYQGDMLFQGMSDNVIITVLK